MTDIVEKLRSTWAHTHNTLVNPNGPEGADEIEKLRKVLREIYDFNTNDDISNEECMRDIARAALEGK